MGDNKKNHQTTPTNQSTSPTTAEFGTSTLPANELAPATAEDRDALTETLDILHKSYQVDFSHYRQTTVLRRLTRRMALCKQSDFVSYRAYLNNHPNEIESLYDDLLLSFTEFFRDPPVFEALRRTVFPKLVKGRSAKTPIRIWVPGCSTGEEVYSLAICAHEFLEEQKSNAKVQLFGTDLVESHIVKARDALYPEKIRSQVTDKRLDQFFDNTQDGLKVTKHIRETCVFAVQDVTQDPPFPRIDLVSCRNVLIYFDTAFQETAIPLFHFALRPGGFLLLGTSESMGRFPHLFAPVDQRANLWSKRESRAKSLYRLPISVATAKPRSLGGVLPQGIASRQQSIDIAQQIDRIILDVYAPACVLVDSSMQIRTFRGPTSQYFEPADGDASLKLSRMAREGLMPDLSVAIDDAKKRRERVVKKAVTFMRDGQVRAVDITVVPVPDKGSDELSFLILFDDREALPAVRESTTNAQVGVDASHNELDQLSEELRLTKAQLQAIIEEKDEVNLELWAANEEVQSTNEELQSVNEEMEAAKEEVESSNEELLTLNEELQGKILQLDTAKNFAENLLETANAIIVTLNEKAEITLFNQYAESLTGYKKADVLGRNWFETFIPESDRALMPQVFEDVLKQMPEVSQFENPIVLKNGEKRLIGWSNNVLRDNSGMITGVLSIGADIHDRHQTEEALRSSEKRFRTFFEFSPFVLVMGDLEGKILVANPAFTRLVGYTAEELEELSFSHITDPSDLKREWPLFEALNSGKRDSYHIEKRTIHKDGHAIWVHIHVIGVRDENGQLEYLIGLGEDITERRQTEQALQRSEEKFRSYVESAPDGIFVANQDGRYTDINQAACQATGYSREELLGMHLLKVTHPDDHDVAKRHFEEVVTTGRASGEIRIVKKEGTIRHWVVDAVKLTPARFLGFATDITELKLMEDKLRQSEKMDAIGQLAGGIAHDFNNQLSGILGYAEVLREEASNNPELVRYTDNILLGVKRASDLTSQLLAFSRKGKYLHTTVDVHRVIFEAVNLLQHSVDKKIVIHQELKANPSTTIGDPTQLQNAILNLAINSRDAMPEGGKLILATEVLTLGEQCCKDLSCEITPGDYLKLSVADSGTGIEQGIVHRIFEPFFTTKGQGKGTGMGLAAVYGTVRNHGGTITVTSQPGEGSRFELYLPLVQAGQDDRLGDHQQQSISGSAHLLLVEDEEMIRDVATHMLEKLGYTVTVCVDGAQAVERYREMWRSIDLVILDVIMPNMDGEQTFLAMREINPEVLVLISSGYSMEGQARNIIDKGAKGFIQKPYRKGELSMVVSNLLSEKKG